MRVTITQRHCAIPDDLRDRARELVARLVKGARRPQAAQVTFSEDHGAAAVELRLHAGRGRWLVATADGADHRSALDRAAGRLRRQIEKAPRGAPARRRAAARETA
jgi:ribosome-associated translation inhibitor RaiA